jgi:hypothetical protein
LGCNGITNQTRTVNGLAGSDAVLVSTTITPFACSFEQTKTIIVTTDGDGDGGSGSDGDGGNGDTTTEEVITTGGVIEGEETGETTTVTTTTQEISGEISDMECSTDKIN